jgi:hybrid cluster-associated redox disulfide protein
MITQINPDMPVDEIMRRWPATIRVFMHKRMLCVGCPIGTFHTVTEVCEEHALEETSFVAELRAAINGGEILEAV